MTSNQSILWLASYPKSGNTWIRAFLSRLLFKANHINHLQIPIYSSKAFIEQEADIDISELTNEYLHKIRLSVYADKAKQMQHFPVKIHDKFEPMLYNMPFLPFEASRIVLYIIRNPFDIAVSFSRHLGKSIDETIEIMNQPAYTLASNTQKYQIQMPQPLGTWSQHVKSWIEQHQLPVFVVKYEDLLQSPEKFFAELLHYCQIPFSNEQLNDAINFTQFDNLKKQEQQYGFEEKSVHSTVFFHTGKSYYYRQFLTSQQIERIYQQHYDVIKQYGYEP